MKEPLELKDGQFRYWFSSDVMIPGGPEYPIEGSYNSREGELVLSSQKIFKIRQINERRVLFWPHAVEGCDQRQIIPGHMLLSVKSIYSEPPTSQSFFTKEQIEESERKGREPVKKNK